MATQLYVNLPVQNLERSKTFFKQLGFSFDMNFTNEKGAGMIIGENIYAMLLQKEFFQTFTSKPIIDANKGTEVIVCFSVETRKEVDDLVKKAKEAGAAVPRGTQDHGFMYGHGFEDLDGHIWEMVSYEQKK